MPKRERLTLYLIVDLFLQGCEARVRLVGLLVTEAAAGELVEVLAGIDAALHRDEYAPRGLATGPRLAHTLLCVPLSETRLVLQQ